MATDETREQLSAKRYMTVSLRLLVDPAGRIVQGEIVGTPGQSPCRFVGWRGLTQALRATITKQGDTGRP